MKSKINANAFIYPMPMTLVGAMVNGRPNFITVAWVTRVNYDPPLIAVALGKMHHTNAGIREKQEFSVNIPATDLLEETDYCGLVSGKQIDKSKIFDVFFCNLKNSPMIEQCPLCMECRLYDTVTLPTNDVFIGEIVGAYCNGDILTDEKPDVRKFSPFMLTMPDNNYWAIGPHAGKAWSIGNKLKV